MFKNSLALEYGLSCAKEHGRVCIFILCLSFSPYGMLNSESQPVFHCGGGIVFPDFYRPSKNPKVKEQRGTQGSGCGAFLNRPTIKGNEFAFVV